MAASISSSCGRHCTTMIRSSVRINLHSHRALSQQHAATSSAPSASSSSSPLRSRRSKRSDDPNVDVSSVDLVGPPDPTSNIRPMVYAEPPSAQRRSRRYGDGQGQNDRHQQAVQTHPYSVNEFSQASKPTQRRLRGLGAFALYRQYVDHVCDRVEEAEMKLRLNKLTTDTTTQRFWRDNNIRFTRDLNSWQEGQPQDQVRQIEGQASGGAQEAKTASASSDPHQAVAVPSPTSGLSSESDFYATWLRANAKRNKAYNVLVWRQTFAQVRLEFEVKAWRSWFAVLRTLEGSSS